jgi:hypothetical protein
MIIEGRGATIQIPSLGLDLPLSEIYAGMDSP